MPSSAFLASAREAVERLQPFGLNGRKRFGDYLSWLTEPKSPETPRDRAKTFEAYSQLGQLVMVARVAEHLDSDALKHALSKVSRGGFLQESDDDVARDTLLELVAAAVFVDAGVAVKLTTNAEDLRIEAPGLGWGVAECKRPRNADSLFKKLRAAATQIGGRLRRDQSLKFGIPVLGLDLVIQSVSQPHSANNEEEVDEALERDKRRIINGLTESIKSESLTKLFQPIPFAALSFSGAFFLKAESAVTVITVFSHLVIGPEKFAKLPPPLEKLFASRQSLYLADIRRRVRGN